MSRRALGRGRLIVVLGAIVTLAGTVPPWWMAGGPPLYPGYSGNAFEGVGLVIFISALAMLALVVLPFTRRDGEAAIDRPSSYVLLAVLAIGAFVLRAYQLAQDGLLALPQDAPGLWLTGAGLLIVAWGVAELLNERPAAW